MRGNKHNIITFYAGTISKSKILSFMLQYIAKISWQTGMNTHLCVHAIIWRPAGIISEVCHLTSLLMLFLLMNLIYIDYCSLWLKLPTLFKYFSELQIILHAMGIQIYAKQLLLYIPTKPSANLLKCIYWRIKAVCL